VTSLDRVRVAWTGTFTGQPGVSTFYFLDAVPNLTHLKDLYGLIAASIPNDVTIAVEGSGETIESTTGEAVGSWSGTAPASLNGGSGAAYSAPVGAIFQWLTGTYFSGRQLKGRTYVVPLASTAFNLDGSLDSGFLATARGAATSQLAAFAGNLVVWQRPRPATPAWTDKYGRTHPAISARGGGHAVVTSGTVPSFAAVLRSRRD